MNTTALVSAARLVIARSPGLKDEVLAVLNGAMGDHLEAAKSPLALETRWFLGPELRELDLEPHTSSISIPHDAGPSVCVLIHGLMGSHRAWSLPAGRGERVEYGAALAKARGITPLYVGYNTGRHVSTNGREVADQLQALLDAWPCPIEELTILGHSMGGLVARSACHYAQVKQHGWTRDLQRVFLIGSPSHGARLEQVAHLGAFVLETVWNPWTKLIGRAINLRAAGIKDLRHGFVLDEDWQHRDPDELALAAPRPARVPEGVRWFVVSGALGEAGGTAEVIVGDMLVTPKSAAGRGFGTPEPGLIPELTTHHIEHVSHIELMNDPRVLDKLLEWWD